MSGALGGIGKAVSGVGSFLGEATGLIKPEAQQLSKSATFGGLTTPTFDLQKDQGAFNLTRLQGVDPAAAFGLNHLR